MMHDNVQGMEWSQNATEPSAFQSEMLKTIAEIRSQSADVAGLMTALAKAQGKIGDIDRDRTVEVKPRSGNGYTFRYATLANIIKGIKEALSTNNIAYTQVLTYEPKNGLYYLTTSLHHGNQFISSVVPLIVTDQGNQQFGSALTYMKRYSLAALVGVAADEDDDGNAADGNEVQNMRAKPDPIVAPPMVPQPRPVGRPRKVPVLPEPGPEPDEIMGEDLHPEAFAKVRKIDVELNEDGETHDWMGWGKQFISTARALENVAELDEFERLNSSPLKNMELNNARMYANLSVSLIKVRKAMERA